MTTTIDQGDLLAPLWIHGDVLALDFEATSPDPYTARPVSVALVKVSPSAEVTPLLSTLIWCDEPIPADAERVHGVTSERARKEGRHPCVALGLLDLALDPYPGIPVVIFNAGYDLTLLRTEWNRWSDPHYGERLLSRHPILDPLQWDRHHKPYRKSGERKLGALCAEFGVTLADAHEATADATAVALLAFAMARATPEIARRPLEEFAAWQESAFAKWRDGLNLYWIRKRIDRKVGGTWLEPERLAPARDL